MAERSKLIKMRISNLGCVGHGGLEVSLDNIICIVGANNCGKSTILRAYELAIGNEVFNKDYDLCKSVPDGPVTVEIWVHIPIGTPNIAEKWKTEENGLLLVQSKWEWSSKNNWKKKRFTWDPDISDYADDGNASGLDTVFNSRLPQPFRIGSLDDPNLEHGRLLELILQPIADKLKQEMKTEDSELKNAISSVTLLANKPIVSEKDTLIDLKTDLNKSHNYIFPDLSIDFEIGIGNIPIDPLKLLKDNSHLKFTEWEQELHWSQQGTGSQRALFWTMLQIRSKLKTVFDAQQQIKKDKKDLEKQIGKLQTALNKAKTENTKKQKRAAIDECQQKLLRLNSTDPVASTATSETDVALPGYMLIIDEPENSLHPNAIRAACEYLYSLADDPSWQVMLATHSPVFINPLKDHTTIIRLDRSQQNPSPNTYRSEDIGFSPDEIKNLKMLNRFDQGLAEMFFGQFPILIEGDTEFAAFESIIARHPNEFPLNDKPVFVRARGKYTLPLVIQMLCEFKVPFAILHDTDSPTLSNGNKNSAWTANNTIYQEIQKAREKGIRVVHRVSISNFEEVYLLDGKASKKDKPWEMFNAIQTNIDIETSVKSLLCELTNPNVKEEPFQEPFGEALLPEWENVTK